MLTTGQQPVRVWGRKDSVSEIEVILGRGKMEGKYVYVGWVQKLRIAPVIAALLLLSVACSGASPGSSPSSSGNPFRILMIVNLTGSASYYGQGAVQSFGAARKFLNKSGGILNRPITIDYVDSQGDPTKAVSLLTQQTNSGVKYDLCVCGTFSAETLALLPATTKAKLLTTSSGGASAFDDPANYPLYFGAQVQQKYPAQALVQQVMKLGYKRPGIFISNDVTGTELLGIYQQLFTSAGIQPIFQQYSPSQLDFTPALQALQAKQPDVVILNAFGAPTGIIFRNRAKLGWTVPVIANTTTASQDLTSFVSMDQLTNVTEQHKVVDIPSGSSHKTAQWQATYDAVIGEGPLVSSLSNYSALFDVLLYFATAAKQAGSTDPDKIRQALENLKTPTPVPWVTWPHPLGYSSTEHFVVAESGDFTFTGVTHLDQGLNKPAS